MKNRTQSKPKLRLTTQIVGTLEGRTTIIGTKTATNIETKLMTKTITATTPVFVSPHVINHVALYIIRKAANRGTILKKNKKNLKPSSGLPIETSLVNLITDLTNDLINTLWIIRIIIS